MFLFTGNKVGEAMGCASIAFAYQGIEDQANAISYMKQAHQAFESCLGAAHPHTAGAQQALNGMQQIKEIERGPCRCDLVVFQTEHTGYGCDGCDMSVPQGTTLHGCRECDFDLCSPCAENRQL
jgi:hypothetical protein